MIQGYGSLEQGIRDTGILGYGIIGKRDTGIPGYRDTVIPRYSDNGKAPGFGVGIGTDVGTGIDIEFGFWIGSWQTTPDQEVMIPMQTYPSGLFLIPLALSSYGQGRHLLSCTPFRPIYPRT